MALSRQVIISDGTTTEYPITFADGYLSRDEVSVYEEFDDSTPNADIAFIFINDYLIELSRVPEAGHKIVIERDVEANARKVNFIPQYIKSSDLNTMYKHLLYLVQSVLDGRFEQAIIKDLDMGYNRIYNLGAPQQPDDAVRLVDIKEYTDLAEDINKQNAAHEAAAKQSEINAKASADASAASATAATTSEANAKTSETNALIWAEGTDAQVQALGGVHSSKVWAEESSKAQVQTDWNQSDNTQKDYIKNKPTKLSQFTNDIDTLPDQTGNADKFLKTDGTTASWAEIGGGLEIGDIGFAPLGIDEAQNKRRYLNGQVISQAQFVSFTNKIKAAIQLYSNLATTETNWQAEVTNSKLGQCGKFVIDDTAGTIRLPKVVNINGLQDLSLLGGIKSESLPNIKGGDSSNQNSLISPVNSKVGNYGAVSIIGDADVSNRTQIGGEAGVLKRAVLNASLSSSTYQDNAPVQQEAIQYPYFIQVATGVEESIDVSTEIQLNNPFSLLDYKWSEYELNNASWLLSNGQFNSGATYPAVYELLLKIYNGTETKAGVSVKLSTETYTDTDFVINTADTTFRLPIKVKLASGNAVVGNGMTMGLTDGTNNFGLKQNSTQGYGFADTREAFGQNVGVTITGNTIPPANRTLGITTDPTKSGIETSSSGLKLYFYVGETIQDANVIAASQVLTDIADLKAHTIIDTYSDDSGNWYRAYSDGWVEQGGLITVGGSWETKNLLKPFNNTVYYIDCYMVAGGSGTNYYFGDNKLSARTTTTFTVGTGQSEGCTLAWFACGRGA